MIELSCIECNNPYLVVEREARRSKYCSRLCHSRAVGRKSGELRHAARIADTQSGIEQPKDYRVVRISSNDLALVDIEDFELALSVSWTLHSQGYAASTRGSGLKRKHLYLHREILAKMLGRQLTRKDVCDHINHDKLDNRRVNLRLASVASNGANMLLPKHNTSGFKGVQWKDHAAGRPWHAAIKVQQRNYFIGAYATAEEAAYAYDQWAMQLFGEFARTNFELSA